MLRPVEGGPAGTGAGAVSVAAPWLRTQFATWVSQPKRSERPRVVMPET